MSTLKILLVRILMEPFCLGLLVLTSICTIWFLNKLWQARRYRSFYESQGIRGPPFRFLVGNIPEIQHLYGSVPLEATTFTTPSKLRIIPDFCHFYKNYGKISIHELGFTTRLLIADTDLIREVLINRASCYVKADLVRESLKPVLGNGVVVSNGEFWRQQRRILNPAFKMAYLKGLTKHMLLSGEDLALKWRSEIEQHGFHPIDAHLEMVSFTMDVISRSSFGESCQEGQVAFECLDKLLSSGLLSLSSYERLIPGHTWLPTPKNLRLWRKERCVNELLKSIIQKRLEKSKGVAEQNFNHDLLDMMLGAVNMKSPTMTMAQLLDECKTIFFAGHSTTALTLTWTLIMLSVHQEWQKRARDEVLAALANSESGFLSAEDLAGLEVVGWIINEVLRMYPPLSSVARQCVRRHKIGNLSILPGTVVALPVLILLQSEEVWGADAFVFNPERFKNKSMRDFPSFMVFGEGPRKCLGMNFALLEAKVLLTLVLREFSFTLSPDYRHAPGNPLSSKPGLGSPLIVHKFKQ